LTQARYIEIISPFVYFQILSISGVQGAQVSRKDSSSLART